MLTQRQTFAQIVARVKETVPTRPNPSDGIEKLIADTHRYNTWCARQYGWMRADGSEVGRPKASDNRRPHGERAAQCENDKRRHIRMVPRHDRDAALAGIARYEGRSKKRLFSRPPFTPRFMRKDSAIVTPAAKPVIVKPVLVTGVSPVTEVYQQELRETCRRFGRTTRFATESPLATRPRQPWKPTPLRLPVALCASGSVLYVDSRVM
jgi:hypothetical protein